MSEQNLFIVIDGPAVLHRAWHALPKLTDPKGRIISAVYGFASVLLKLLREYQPQYLAVAFDLPAPTFRHLEYKEYKATRVPQPQEFYDQIPIAKDLVKTLGGSVLEKEGFEADDLIGTLVSKSPVDNLIVTGDLDTMQLVDDKTRVYFLRQGISEIKIYDREAVEERYGLSPEQLIDFKALRGDPSDNIPGAKGIGEKTALELIQKFSNLESLYDHLEHSEDKERQEIKPTVKKILLEQKEQIFLSKKLVTIKLDVPDVYSAEKYQRFNVDQLSVQKALEGLGFKSLIQRLQKNPLPKQDTLFKN